MNPFHLKLANTIYKIKLFYNTGIVSFFSVLTMIIRKESLTKTRLDWMFVFGNDTRHSVNVQQVGLRVEEIDIWNAVARL